MSAVVKECGELLVWLEKQKQTVKKRPEDETQIYAAMIAEYQRVMIRLEQSFIKQDVRRYLEIRRARYAVKQGFERIVPADILFPWIVENVCVLEAE